MTTPPAAHRDLPVRDGDDVQRLRLELERLVTENAALRAALESGPLANSGTVRALVRRRWIGGMASVLLLALGIAVGVWYTRLIGHEAVLGFWEGYNGTAAALTSPPPAQGTPVALPPKPPSPAPATPAPAPSAPKR